MSLTFNRRTLGLGAGGVLLGLLAWLGLGSVCLRAWLSYGLVTPQCPDGRPRQTLSLQASGLLRGSPGQVRVGATAHFAGPGEALLQAEVRAFEPTLFLVDAGGKETPLLPKEGWREDDAHGRNGAVELPQVPDGDYRLRAKVGSRLGPDTLDVPLPLYSPARVHVITDRPLYEPGHTVRFRAVVLRAKDLVPLDGRPGAWQVRDPSGEVVLEEKAPAGDWGVVAGSFPLDRGAPTGTWKVRWSSGDASDEVGFRVEPFTLPRFRVEAEPSRPFYRPGELPALRGQVVYSSGAPVAGASLELTWTSSGEWPVPTGWLEGGLPRRATTGPDGRFSLALPPVPADLRKQSTLSARIVATDPAGDRVEGNASLLLSEDALQVSAVTELAEGLAEGFNNRLYLRATTADGQVLPGAKLRVQRAWDPKDVGVEAEADEDGVASLQLDPGAPINVVIPPMPVRPPPRAPPVVRGETSDLLSGEEPRLADLTAMDRWVTALAPCARWALGRAEVKVGLRVGPGGAVGASASGDGQLPACVLRILREQRLPPGPERLDSVTFAFSDADLPGLEPEGEAVFDEPEGLTGALQEAVLAARDCVPESAPAAPLPRVLVWQTRKHSAAVELSWAADPRQEEHAPDAIAACAQARIAPRAELPEPATADDLGFARLEIKPSQRMSVDKPQPTVLLGYELRVSARVQGREVGSTRLVLRPGQVPPIRLRASTVLARAGEAVEVEVLRGPDFSGTLPEKLALTVGPRQLEAPLDPKTRTARFTLPASFEGWSEVAWNGARTLIYVRPRAQLSVDVSPDREQYAPGQSARLSVHTAVGGQGGPAAVGLFGVDESLSQLAPLPGPDELARVRPPVTVSAPAFGVLDGQALAMGRIRGRNAAIATVLRVTSAPTPVQLETPVSASGAGAFDPAVELADRFYTVLDELHAQARAWEESAAPGELATPRLLATLWERALAACEKRNQPVTDAFGRRLKLSRLPPDLLALTDPRAVVVGKTHLPEDVENWQAWVAKEEP